MKRSAHDCALDKQLVDAVRACLGLGPLFSVETRSSYHTAGIASWSLGGLMHIALPPCEELHARVTEAKRLRFENRQSKGSLKRAINAQVKRAQKAK